MYAHIFFCEAITHTMRKINGDTKNFSWACNGAKHVPEKESSGAFVPFRLFLSFLALFCIEVSKFIFTFEIA